MVIKNVPYYSQFIDVEDSFWMLRACGAVSLKIVAEYEGAKVPDIVSLCDEARKHGGYDVENGWIHDYILTKAREFGLSAYREEGLTNVDDIITHIDEGHPVIVSVEKRVLEQKRFHLIVLVGYEKQNDLQGIAPNENYIFFYHEPESTDKERGQYRKVDLTTFMEYWRGKAIFIRNSIEDTIFN